MRRIIARHPDIPFWLCVGDVADDRGTYESFEAPVYWIKGNNENFDLLAAPEGLPHTTGLLAAPEGLPHTPGLRTHTPGLRDTPEGLGHTPGLRTHIPGLRNHYYIPNGQLIEIPVGQPFRGCLTVAGLGGTLAPTWYDTPAAELPHPKKGSVKATELADKRRHFVREEVDACKAMRGVDVFLSHEAPRPFRVGRMDAGKTPINEVLDAMRPRLHLFGHHHRFSEQVIQAVRSVGLDLVSRSYLLIDSETLETHTLRL